jgi:putative transposase
VFGTERRACRVIKQPRSTQRYEPSIRDDKQLLRSQIVALAERYGRYGYRRITALLKIDGWQVNHKRVQRIWREEGLRIPSKQPKRDRLWFADGSCIRKGPEYRNHVWSYNFV